MKISNLREIRILKFFVKKFLKLKWDLHCLAGHKVLWVWLTQTKKYMKKITCIGCEITRGKFWHHFLAGQPAIPYIENLKKRLAPALTGALTWKFACRSLIKLYNFDILWNFLSDELFIITKFKKRLVYASHPCDVTSQSPNSVFWTL